MFLSNSRVGRDQAQKDASKPPDVNPVTNGDIGTANARGRDSESEC